MATSDLENDQYIRANNCFKQEGKIENREVEKRFYSNVEVTGFKKGEQCVDNPGERFA